jgi:hypothetical protein
MSAIASQEYACEAETPDVRGNITPTPISPGHTRHASGPLLETYGGSCLGTQLIVASGDVSSEETRYDHIVRL